MKTFTIRIDKSAPPAPTIIDPVNGSFDTDSVITISGTAEANATVEAFEVAASGDISKGTTQADAAGAWVKTLSDLSDGTHTYKATAKDAAGNASGFSNASTVKVDTIKPRVSLATPLSGEKNVAPVTNVAATFSERMRVGSLRNPTTLRSAAFILVEKNADGSTTRVAAKARYDEATKKAVLDPDANLVRGTRYMATVTTAAKDRAGNALDQNSAIAREQPKKWTFAVRPG